MYDYITLTQTNIDGSISPFPNGASGLILLGTGTSTPPVWASLADAGIATKTYVDNTFLPLSGGTLAGALTGTSASFSGGVTATGGFTGDLTGTASSAAKVANALSIQLGTGTAQSYDGSNPLSISVTPAAIGAALAIHEHALTDITSAWPTAGLMVSRGTTVQPTSIAWPSGTNSDGAYLLLHYKNGTFTDTWEKFAGISSGAGILHWTGTGTGATLNLLQTEHEGYVLARTSSGYDFISLGSAIVPPITELQSDSTSPGKILIVGASPDYAPTWDDLTNIPTGLSAGIAKIDSNGKLTSGSVALGGSEVSGTLGVGNGGTGTSTLTPYALLAGGTTNTGSIQQLGTATANYVLVGNGASALPTWQEKAPKATLADSATTAATATSANTLTTPHTLTIGNTGKTFDGSADVSWSQNEIGFASGQTKTFSLTETGWWRIASCYLGGIGVFCFNSAVGSQKSYGIFTVAITKERHPQIQQLAYSYYNNSNTNKIHEARIIYSSSYAYLEVYFIGSGNVEFELSDYYGWSFLSEATLQNNTPAEGYSEFNYKFYENEAYGTPGQVLATNSAGNGHVWATLPTIPSAPSSLPLVDNETGALGTAGTYANADHQHPLPYAVQAAYKFFYPRKIGIGGAVTAEAQEYDGTSDLILQATQIDTSAIVNTVPIEKGGTGATTATAALTNLGAAAANHNHDSTYLKLSGGNMTGTINTPDNITPLYWAGKSGVATFVSGDLTAQDNVSSYVTGRRQNINLYDSDVSSDSASPTTINHTAKNDTTVNIVCGINEVHRYIRYINLPTPTADMLGDTITVYFTNQKPSVIAELFATCSTNYRIKSYDYSNFGNTVGVDANCKWSSGNVVKFTCINLENNGTTYYWRAVKLVEQSW